MKFFFLLRKRLAQYYMKNKVIFLLFVLGGALNAIVFCFSYGNLLPAMTNRGSQEIQYREYFVRYFDGVKSLEEKETALEEIQNSGLLESVRLCWQENNDIDGRLICACVYGSRRWSASKEPWSFRLPGRCWYRFPVPPMSAPR